ncbi:hypothetical protein BGZ70_008343 [Mortierella alpina]|uniref:Hydroxysteroid dehydrogenase-like protein 2 n=1 Tax=Mortierella alpina TaxID=64518 RepID=A0A9P6J3N1_MORAP|nr:hypothetical protein BGZ70_008343 [Mortierella alpina]
MDNVDPHAQNLPSGGPARRRKTDQGAINPIEATVTKLLVATKQLLEGLTLWSTRKMTEDQVSDIFVQLATQFNLASQSFHEVGIDTSELAHIPDDLRNCLETALGEEPSPSSLEQYLPNIKAVIINLLQGLRLKQNLYREQYEAKSARLQASAGAATTAIASTSSGRSKSIGSQLRQPGMVRSPDLDGASRSQSLNAGPTPTLSVTTPRDEQGHAETLASLRKSDAITRRASSRRHSQRFSTLLEQNTPPVPRRSPLAEPSMMSPHLGHGSSQGSTPAASPAMPLPYGQFPSMPGYVQRPASPALSSSSLGRSLDRMPIPPSIPMPPPPTGVAPIPPSASSPLGSSSMSVSNQVLDITTTTQPPLATNGSSDTINSSGAAPTTASLADASSAMSLPLTDAPSEPIDTGLTLFLQVGKSVKKTKFEGELTHSALRMLFMEKFQYNPGQEDFPTIYVKDTHTNIHYELESLADVKQNAFLSLNVDENIQRKMDQGFAALTKELSDIKKAQEMSEAARQKAASAAAAAGSMPSTPNAESSQMLRSPHYLEVQSLRRDLGVARQLYTELQSETKASLSQLASVTAQIRKQALEQPVSARIFIESGKVKLDKKSEDLTNKIEELQDVVEDMKLNVTQRRGKPSDISMAFVDKQSEEVEKEIAELSDYIQALRPSWKKTWEVELQTIVKEQMFLKEQEALLEDLKEDRSSLVQTLANLKKVLELQNKNGGVFGTKTRDFVFQPTMVDDGFEGLKTVLEEVKLIEPDSDKRLKAMAQMEKLRHIELSNRIDEFEEELTTFVGSSKLRKTGGALEVERQRQQRDLENLKAMFSNKDPAVIRQPSGGAEEPSDSVAADPFSKNQQGVIMSLQGKTLFISGASRGIGLAIALRAAREKACIAIAAKTATPHPTLPGTIYTAAEEIEKAGGKALPIVCDIRDEEQVQNAINQTVDKFGGIDILVNNASAISLTDTQATTVKKYDLMHQINGRGTWMVSKYAIPHLIKSGKNPHILNLSPPLSMKEAWFKNHVAYTMSKMNMSMCVLGMAGELRKHKIGVNALWPLTLIGTAALSQVGDTSKMVMRTPEIMADAAYEVFLKDSAKFSGNFLVDELFLRREGFTDMDQYAPGVRKFTPDFFLPDDVLKEIDELRAKQGWN